MMRVGSSQKSQQQHRGQRDADGAGDGGARQQRQQAALHFQQRDVAVVESQQRAARQDGVLLFEADDGNDLAMFIDDAIGHIFVSVGRKRQQRGQGFGIGPPGFQGADPGVGKAGALQTGFRQQMPGFVAVADDEITGGDQQRDNGGDGPGKAMHQPGEPRGLALARHRENRRRTAGLRLSIRLFHCAHDTRYRWHAGLAAQDFGPELPSQIRFLW